MLIGAPPLTVAAHPFQVTAEDNQAVTISIGISRVPDDLEGNDTTIALKLLSATDEALFVAKKYGRNKVVIEEQKPTDVGVETVLPS